MSLRNVARVGSAVSVISFVELGSSVSIRRAVRIGNNVSVLDLLQLAAASPCGRSPGLDRRAASTMSHW